MKRLGFLLALLLLAVPSPAAAQDYLACYITSTGTFKVCPGNVRLKSTYTLGVSYLPSAIPATLLGAGTVDNTELGYLDGVTSAIQTQLNAKQATLTLPLTKANGGWGSDVSTGLTNNYVAIVAGGAITVGPLLAAALPSAIDAAKIGGGTVSNTAFAYLANVTSDIQTQLDSKLASSSTKLPPTPTAANKLLYDTGSAYAETTACSSATTVLVGGSPPACAAVPIGAIPTGTSSSTVTIGNDARLPASPSAAGGTLYDTGSAWARLAAGTANYLYQANGASAPSWVNSITGISLAGTYTIGGSATLGANLAAGSNKITGLGAPSASSSDAATATYAETVATAAKTGSSIVLASFNRSSTWSSGTYIGPFGVTENGGAIGSVIPLKIAVAGSLKNCRSQAIVTQGNTTNMTVYQAAEAESPSFSATSMVLTQSSTGHIASDTSHTITTAAGDLFLLKVDQNWSGPGLVVGCQFIPN